jgi:hypothetical protein
MRTLRERLLLGLGNALPDEPFDARTIQIHFDGRGVVRSASGPLLNAIGAVECRSWRSGEAKAALHTLEILEQLEQVVLETECHANGRRKLVRARITEHGADRLDELRAAWRAAAGADR